MSSPPVLRLSQALYNDAATLCNGHCTTAQRRIIPSKSHKRALEAPPASVQTAKARPRHPRYSAVRLSLPKAFAIADRTYHATRRAEQVSEDDSGKQGGQIERKCPCESDAQSSEQTNASEDQQNSSDQLHMLPETDEHGCSDMVAGQLAAVVADDAPCHKKICGLERLLHCHPVVTAAEVVVVESVSGFSTAHELLEQSSYERDNSCGESEALGTATESEGISWGGDGEAGQRRTVAEAASDEAASEAVQRLVGWIELAIATAAAEQDEHDALPRSSSSTDEMQSRNVTSTNLPYDGATARRIGRSSSVVGATTSAGQSAALDNDGEADVSPTGVLTAGAISYEVTGRCDVGTDWSVFYLEPTCKGYEHGLIEAKKTRKEKLSGIAVLDVHLICHPLITMVPDIRWCLRLMAHARAIASLMKANAELSTLGGGYFLTRQIGQAIHLARTQAQVATALGDLQLAGKCRVNVAYNYIWLGDYTQARSIIDAQVAAARAIHDEELKTVATIARKFLSRAKKANRRLLLTDTSARQDSRSKAASCGEAAAVGDRGWTRPKIDVKTDEWHRVRALPMYRSATSSAAAKGGSSDSLLSG